MAASAGMLAFLPIVSAVDIVARMEKLGEAAEVGLREELCWS